MAAALQVAQHHDAAQVADVQGVGCGVGAEVGGYHLFLEEFLGAGHHLCQHPTPFQFFNKILFHILIYFLFTVYSLRFTVDYFYYENGMQCNHL